MVPGLGHKGALLHFPSEIVHKHILKKGRGVIATWEAIHEYYKPENPVGGERNELTDWLTDLLTHSIGNRYQNKRVISLTKTFVMIVIFVILQYEEEGKRRLKSEEDAKRSLKGEGEDLKKGKKIALK